MADVELTELLGAWARGREPLFRQLAAALQAAVARGDLMPGVRVPAERQLAQVLAVSRTTVTAAYDELVQTGCLERRRGAGTFVTRRTRTLDVRLPEADVIASYGIARVVRESLHPTPTLIDLSAAAFRDPAGVAEAMRVLGVDGLPATDYETGYLPAGHSMLRTRIADHLDSIGVPTQPTQILVTSGVQQAANLLAALYAPDGGPIVVEDPTWTGLLDALRAYDARLLAIPVDEGGARIDQLKAIATRTPPKFAWLTSGFHNPTGARLTEERAEQAAHLAEELQFPLVENVTLRELQLGAEPAARPIAAWCPDRGVVTVGSLSKLFWPGLRLGWIRASEQAVARLARLKAVWDNGTSVVSQFIGAHLLANSAHLLDDRRSRARTTLAVVEAELRTSLPDWRWSSPAGGLSVWVEIPAGSAYELAQVAIRHMVEFVPGAAFSPREAFRKHLRIPVTQSPEITRQGIHRLARAWSSYTSRR